MYDRLRVVSFSILTKAAEGGSRNRESNDRLQHTLNGTQ